MQYSNVVIFSYHYLLDPKIAERVSRDFSKDCIVVFDEAHNIDNVCIEALSTDITEESLRKATRGARRLEKKIVDMRESDQEKLKVEYQKLVEGLRVMDDARQEDTLMSNPGNQPSARPNKSIAYLGSSTPRRSSQGSCSRKHTTGRALCNLPQEVYRILEGF